ncbi:MAG: type 1 glutamine amidotransferase family protein [Acidobacteriota bacterium]
MLEAKVYILVFDGFADWEPTYALAEIRRSGELQVVSVGFSDKPVISMGGLRIVPDCALTDVNVKDVRLFILPGGDMWENDYPTIELEQILHKLEQSHVPIAAICGATLVLARAGLLRNRKHTSNAKDYLTSFVPGYGNESDYIDKLAVRDQRIITASGVGAIEFAYEIFDQLGIFSDADRKVWFDLFKYGKFPQPIA